MDKLSIARLSLGTAITLLVIYIAHLLLMWMGIDVLSEILTSSRVFALLLISSVFFTISILIYENVDHNDSPAI